ncbi:MULTISPECIES: ABC transporter substrate-binding protein [Gammaproteobacteria]|uniref:substrate-binding periplasmic protein n=1 Tax=Gammaproteobacteria TaxID=1236 RepID=UPI000DCFCDA2|nr:MULTISPECIES: transporter substrate-binding domain-containing protein [Gammaproteobacteria]RTE85591.1 transporter substrate-binding domain-containing protein [Aliidiomarina sp. B3213]TCZ89561.1 transporter substrate-binding domain-containing protein [Lysobacter sp. N42]
MRKVLSTVAAVFLFFGVTDSSDADEILHFLLPLNMPPYIDLSTNTGYELELIEMIVEEMGATVNYTHVPIARLSTTLPANAFDAATLQRPTSDTIDFYYSCPYIEYHNLIVSRADDNIVINQLNDLIGLHVIAFQTATRALGPSFANAAEQASEYVETVDQGSQVEMLMRQRTNAIVLDENILNYYLGQYSDVPTLNRYPIATTRYQVAFKDPSLQQRFDSAQQRIWQTEAYQQLQRKYFNTVNQQLAAHCDF